jgi:hypothetical protein
MEDQVSSVCGLTENRSSSVGFRLWPPVMEYRTSPRLRVLRFSPLGPRIAGHGLHDRSSSWVWSGSRALPALIHRRFGLHLSLSISLSLSASLSLSPDLYFSLSLSLSRSHSLISSLTLILSHLCSLSLSLSLSISMGLCTREVAQGRMKKKIKFSRLPLFLPQRNSRKYTPFLPRYALAYNRKTRKPVPQSTNSPLLLSQLVTELAKKIPSFSFGQ